MHELTLAGCGSRPLAGYLKALGVLRAVACQVDRSARVRWGPTALELRSSLARRELSEFFFTRYTPSPVLSPWNGRSGFYARGNTTATTALRHVEEADGKRFAPYRALVRQTREILLDLEIEQKPEGDRKEELVRTLRERWPDDAIEWLDASIVIAGEKPAFPPLLGSGGNEGSYDFSSNYMQAIKLALDPTHGPELLEASMHGSAAPLVPIKMGHLQSDASPTNSPGGESESLGNPWDLVLAVEGSMLLVGGAARRHADGVRGILTAPFTVDPSAAGYGGAVSGEKGRAELWLPLWSGWSTHAEIGNLIRESRAQVGSGRRRRSAGTGLDFARAAGELGVARGIDAFERYTILERYGQSNIAVSAGRIQVAHRPGADSLRTIDRWMARVLQFAGTKRCPSSVAIDVRRLERACFDLATSGRPVYAALVLEHLGAVESAIARSGSAIESGLRPLRDADATPWIAAADDGSAEFALAASIGSLRSRDPKMPAVRDYLHGSRRSERGATEFDPDRRHLVSANSALRLLASLHAQSHLDHFRRDAGPEDREDKRRSVAYEWGLWCDARVARRVATGALDLDRVLRLAGGFALLSYEGIGKGPRRQHELPAVPVPAYDALALAWWRKPSSNSSELASLGPRPGWAARLASGTVEPVLRDALLRLRLAGVPLVASFRDLMTGSPSGEALGAALLVPPSGKDLASLEQRLIVREEPEFDQEDADDQRD